MLNILLLHPYNIFDFGYMSPSKCCVKIKLSRAYLIRIVDKVILLFERHNFIASSY